MIRTAILLLALASLASAQTTGTTQIIVIKSAILPVGTTVSASKQLTTDITYLEVVWDASRHTDPNTILTIELETSHDGGVTWASVGKCVCPGSMKDKETGKQITEGWAKFAWSPAIVKPMVRGRITVAGSPLNTGATILYK